MILLYHHICPTEAIPKGRPLSEGWNFCHSPEGFERQLTALRSRGFQFVSMGSLIEDIRNHGKEKAKTVIVTFDDGWVDNHRFALPVLQRLSIPATFFVVTGHLRRSPSDSKRMNVSQLRDLIRAGMTIGAHTRSHPDLTSVPLELARSEIAGCKDDLEQSLGMNVLFFAYPGGAFNWAVSRMVQEAGFEAACSVLGPAPNDRSTLLWLYRDVLSESMNRWGDRYRLSPIARQLFSFRVRRKLRRQLGRKAN